MPDCCNASHRGDAVSYYLEDHPNPNTPQYGWARTWVSGVVGVHTTESGVDMEGPDAGAENTAAFIARRTDYGSYHILADWDTIVPLTRPTFAAWADTTNNVHALSVSGAMNAARWRDLPPERAAGIVRNMGIAAAMLVRDAIAHGVLAEVVPARRITAQEAISGSRPGFYGHGETNPGTRYDPGTHFDWDLFLATYAAAVGGGINYHSTTEDDMANVSDEQLNFIIKSLESLVNNVATKQDLPSRGQIEFTEAALRSLVQNVTTKADLPGVSAAVASAVGAKATAEEIEAAVRAGMTAGLRVSVSVEDTP